MAEIEPEYDYSVRPIWEQLMEIGDSIPMSALPLTRERILALPVGWELDRQIDTRVMGLEAIHRMVPRYSRDIAAAWQVVEKMILDGWEFNIEYYSRTPDAPWLAMFNRPDGDAQCVGLATAPHAICLAALLTTLEAQ